jgi:tRNA A37 threonylcarbamoyladenosine dehydratase
MQGPRAHHPLPMTSDRFDGIGRLYTPDGLTRLQRAHVCVVGIGGVGSWAAEAIARSGVGQLTLVDLDEVCVSNVNRQLHALEATVGRAKVLFLAPGWSGSVASGHERCDLSWRQLQLCGA